MFLLKCCLNHVLFKVASDWWMKLTVYCQELTVCITCGLVKWKVNPVVYICPWVWFSVILKCFLSEFVHLNVTIQIDTRDIMRKANKDSSIVFLKVYIFWRFVLEIFWTQWHSCLFFSPFVHSCICSGREVVEQYWKLLWRKFFTPVVSHGYSSCH